MSSTSDGWAFLGSSIVAFGRMPRCRVAKRDLCSILGKFLGCMGSIVPMQIVRQCTLHTRRGGRRAVLAGSTVPMTMLIFIAAQCEGFLLSHSIVERTATAGSSPAASSFAQLPLDPATVSALRRMGITEPTPIQATALPLLFEGRDVIGQARTGSGKTLAFVLPAIELIDRSIQAVQVLVLTPTRELAVQIDQVLAEVTQGRGIRSVLIFGGRAAGPQITALRRGAQVVIGTPGRVLDLLRQGALSLDRVRFLALDEADAMLDQGFAPDVERILTRTPRQRQTALFSATLPEWVRKTADKHLRKPVTVSVDAGPSDVPTIEHTAYDVPSGDKLSALRDLLDLRGDGSIIVFGRTKHGVKKLAGQLEWDGYPVGALQGNLSQNARDRVMEQFRSGEVQILVATNVAARVLDITSVEQVINLELPESPELLTHRVGRTGRMGREGRAITLLDAKDGAKWRQLERALGGRIPRARWRGAHAALGLDPRSATGLPRRHVGEVWRVSADLERASARLTDARVRRERRTHVQGDTQYRADSVPRQSPSLAWNRESTIITCSTCGTEATVPFRPDPSRPVYCNDCHRARRPNRRTPATRR